MRKRNWVSFNRQYKEGNKTRMNYCINRKTDAHYTQNLYTLLGIIADFTVIIRNKMKDDEFQFYY